MRRQNAWCGSALLSLAAGLAATAGGARAATISSASFSSGQYRSGYKYVTTAWTASSTSAANSFVAGLPTPFNVSSPSDVGAGYTYTMTYRISKTSGRQLAGLNVFDSGHALRTSVVLSGPALLPMVTTSSQQGSITLPSDSLPPGPQDPGPSGPVIQDPSPPTIPLPPTIDDVGGVTGPQQPSSADPAPVPLPRSVWAAVPLLLGMGVGFVRRRRATGSQ